MQDTLRLNIDNRAFFDLIGVGDGSGFNRFTWTPNDSVQRWHRIDSQDAAVAETLFSTGRNNIYVTPNEFFAWRNTKNLARLHCNWIDIDTAGHGSVTPQQAQRIVAEVEACLSESGLPSPTGITHTGSGGLHLYWFYDPVDAFPSAVRKWRDIGRMLCDHIARIREQRGYSLWQLDYAASTDPTRVMRLPGSLHGKSGRVVSFQSDADKTCFRDLSRLVAVSPLPSSAMSRPEKNRRKNANRHSIKQWWFKTYSEVLANLRQEHDPVGRRDHYLFILFVALQHIKGDNCKALLRIHAINHRYLKLDEHRVTQYLSSAMKVRYRYRKKTLIQYLKCNLNMDTRFLETPDKPPALPRSEVARRQRQAALTTALTKRTKTLGLIQTAIASLTKTRSLITLANLHSSTGLSFSTLRRHLVDYEFH